nr:hypothetical protein [Tanacetum cinerariifolium]
SLQEKDTYVPQPSGPTEFVADKAIHKKLGDRLVRAAITASSLEAEQDSGGGPRCQETIEDTIAQTRFERVSKQSNDLLIARGNTLQSDKDSLKLDELMELCTNIQNRVLDLEQTKTTQKKEIGSQRDKIASLKRRVESSGDEESLGEDASKQGGRINAIDADEDITLLSVADNEMFDVNVLGGEEVFVAGQNENVVEEAVDAAQVTTTATTVTITTEKITLAQVLKALKTSKPKVKGIVFQEPKKPVKPKKKEQTRLDEEAAKNLQAEFDEEERLQIVKAKKEERANILLIEEWDDIRAKIDADHQLAERMQAQEQEELSTSEQCWWKEKKRTGEELVQEITKKQKVEDDKEKAELKQLMKTISDEEEVAIDATPLAIKSPRIVD